MEIRRIREDHRLTQQELAAKAGVTQAYISQLEKASKTNPSYKVLIRIADALSTSVDELIRDKAV